MTSDEFMGGPSDLVKLVRERDALIERVEWLRAALKQEEGFGSIIAAAALRADDEARGA